MTGLLMLQRDTCPKEKSPGQIPTSFNDKLIRFLNPDSVFLNPDTINLYTISFPHYYFQTQKKCEFGGGFSRHHEGLASWESEFYSKRSSGLHSSCAPSDRSKRKGTISKLDSRKITPFWVRESMRMSNFRAAHDIRR